MFLPSSISKIRINRMTAYILYSNALSIFCAVRLSTYSNTQNPIFNPFRNVLTLSFALAVVLNWYADILLPSMFNHNARCAPSSEWCIFPSFKTVHPTAFNEAINSSSLIAFSLQRVKTTTEHNSSNTGMSFIHPPFSSAHSNSVR